MSKQQEIRDFIWPRITKEDADQVYEYLRENKPLSILDNSGIYVELEQMIRRYYRSRFSLLMSSGTAALHSAFFALGIGKGDEVIAPTNTFRATVTPLLQLGAVPVLCDSQYENGNIDPEQIVQRITKRTRSIVVTHLWGNPVNMRRIVKIARENDLTIVEDCSHAHGTTYFGKKVGMLGDIGCFSMQSGKLVFAGEGGFIITNNRELYERAVLLGHSGKKARQVIKTHKYSSFSETGYGLKYRIHPLGAVIAKTQFKKLDKRLRECEQNINYYKERFGEIDILTPEENEAGTGRRAYFSFVLKYNKGPSRLARDKLISLMLAKRIQVRNDDVSFKPLHLQRLFQTKNDLRSLRLPLPNKIIYGKGDLPISEKYTNDVIHLPPFIEPAHDMIDSYSKEIKRIEGDFWHG